MHVYLDKYNLLSLFGGVRMYLFLQFKVPIIGPVFKIITIVVVLGPFGPSTMLGSTLPLSWNLPASSSSHF